MGGFSGGGVDIDRANSARMYDYFLDGSHHFAVDRELGDRVESMYPAIRATARANRTFLMRVVRLCVESGVRQFLDLGSGIPTVDHVHVTARAIRPEVRVAYVDVEPVAVAHSRELLADVEGVTITEADVTDPAAVLSAPSVTEVIDFREPLAVLAVAMLHFVPDAADPEAVLAAYRASLVPGSFLALTHGSFDYDDPEFVAQLERATAVYRDSTTPGQLRSRAQLRALLGGTPDDLVDPGLVDVAHWRADPAADRLGLYAAVRRIR